MNPVEHKEPTLPKIGVLHAVLAGLIALLLAGGWSFAEATVAYAATAGVGTLGVLLILGRPRLLSWSPLTLVALDSGLISLLVFDTGGGGSPFFPLYLLAALGMVRIVTVLPALSGTSILVGSYLVAVIVPAAPPGLVLSPETGLNAGLISLFCAVAIFLGVKMRDTRDDARRLALTVAAMRENEEKVATIVSGFAPALKVLDTGSLLSWVAHTVQKLLGAPYVHAALLDGYHHRTAAVGDLDAYPSWWHPDIQRLLLWSCRTGEVLDENITLHGIKGFVAVPIISEEDQGIGALVIGVRELGAWEERTLKLLAAELASVLEGVENAPGGRDSVSELPNSTSLRSVLEQDFGTLTLLVAKMDRTWDYRRIYGPAAWDGLLGKVGSRLGESHLRVFRQGDKLAVVLMGSGKDRAQKVARNIQQTVAALTKNSAVVLSASVGFVVAKTGMAKDAELLLDTASDAADKAENQTGEIFGVSLEELWEGLRGSEDGPLNKESTRALLKALEARAPYLGAHSRTVSRLALGIGSEMRLSRVQMDALEVGALLHDLGKIGIPDSILQKPARLTCEEYEIVKEHPVLGARIIAEEEDLLAALPAVRHHHERFDGKGYPDGLRGKEIPLIAQIVCVADALDTMIRDQPYQRGVSRQAAMTEVVRHSGTQFAPEVVAVLERLDDWSIDVAN